MKMEVQITFIAAMTLVAICFLMADCEKTVGIAFPVPTVTQTVIEKK